MIGASLKITMDDKIEKIQRNSRAYLLIYNAELSSILVLRHHLNNEFLLPEVEVCCAVYLSILVAGTAIILVK